MAERKIRVLLAMPGQDGLDRGARAVALALRGAGMEVIYAGAHRIAEQVAAVALQEDVDAVLLCVPPGSRPSLPRGLLETLASLDIRNDLKVAVGGAVSSRDAPRLRRMGVDGVFPAGAPAGEIVAWLRGSTRTRNERGTA